MRRTAPALLLSLPFPLTSVHDGPFVVRMSLLDEQGAGKAIGTITVSENAYGGLLTPALTDLAPGAHGFHVHENPSCAPAVKDGATVPVSREP